MPHRVHELLVFQAAVLPLRLDSPGIHEDLTIVLDVITCRKTNSRPQEVNISRSLELIAAETLLYSKWQRPRREAGPVPPEAHKDTSLATCSASRPDECS